jgi:hypothetical protein
MIGNQGEIRAAPRPRCIQRHKSDVIVQTGRFCVPAGRSHSTVYSPPDSVDVTEDLKGGQSVASGARGDSANGGAARRDSGPVNTAASREHAIEFLLGVPPEESYDRMARVVAASLQAPMAIVTVSEMGRQVVRGCVGVAGRARAWRSVPDARLLVQRSLIESRPLLIDAEHLIQIRETARPGQIDGSTQVIAVAPFICRDRRTTGAVCVPNDSGRRKTSCCSSTSRMRCARSSICGAR